MTKIQDLKEQLQLLVQLATKENLYCDINMFETKEQRMILDNVNTDISKDSDKGIKIRVWDGSKFLEYATTSFDEKELKSKLEELIEQAKTNLENKEELSIDSEKLSKDFLPQFSIKDLSLEKQKEQLESLKKTLEEIDEDIVNVRVGLITENEKHLFVNKYKTLYQEIPINLLVMICYVKTQSGSVNMVFESFVNKDYSMFEKANSSLEEFKKKIIGMKKAQKLEGGKYKVVLAPKVTGLLAHESFGHGMEADTMMKDRALSSEWAGKKIGAENINIVDYPNIEGKHGHFYFDHEGNMARKTYLVKNGIITEPMADLYSKTKLKLEHSSNSRFESFDHKHYTRMSNTYFEKGEQSVDELISSVDDGIYITEPSGGMEDPRGWSVQIQGCFGQRIKNGKLIDEFYDGFSLTGFLPDIVKNIAGLSSEVEIDGGGTCGKGHKEWVRVSDGGPYMLINEVILG